MVVFDATIILALWHPENSTPRDPDTNLPVEAFIERITYLVERLEKSGEKVIIPTPVLSEILVRANSAAPEYLEKITRSSVFRPVAFDVRAAIEVAGLTRTALQNKKGDKRDGSEGTHAKIKYDRQIIAIAKVEGASTIYSDDKGIYNLGAQNGITVLRVADLPLRPVGPQIELDLSGDHLNKKPEDEDNGEIG